MAVLVRIEDLGSEVVAPPVPLAALVVDDDLHRDEAIVRSGRRTNVWFYAQHLWQSELTSVPYVQTVGAGSARREWTPCR
jgi:hypothetical protein